MAKSHAFILAQDLVIICFLHRLRNFEKRVTFACFCGHKHLQSRIYCSLYRRHRIGGDSNMNCNSKADRPPHAHLQHVVAPAGGNHHFVGGMPIDGVDKICSTSTSDPHTQESNFKPSDPYDEGLPSRALATLYETTLASKSNPWHS